MATAAEGHVAFLHTAPSNVDLYSVAFFPLSFRAEIEGRHHVRDDLLARAREAGGVTAGIAEATAQAMREAEADGADIVLCTCSTIGAAAEAAAPRYGARFLRTDRPLAEEALASAPEGRVLIAATFASTLAPTEALFAEVAAARGGPFAPRLLLIEEAAAQFDAGDLEAYDETIAKAVRAALGDAEAVALAQASMAGAAKRLEGLSVPMLTSPAAGVRAAVAAYKALHGLR